MDNERIAVTASTIRKGDSTGTTPGHWSAITDAQHDGVTRDGIKVVRVDVRYIGDGALETLWLAADSQVRILR